jgi:hypothetical protein
MTAAQRRPAQGKGSGLAQKPQVLLIARITECRVNLAALMGTRPVALGVTPERQAAIRGILGSQLQGKSSRNGSEHKLSPNRASKKKAAPRK